jgi:hypothetical protein
LKKFDINDIYLFIHHSCLLNAVTMHISQNGFSCHKQSQPHSVRSLLETIPSPFQSNYRFAHTTAHIAYDRFFVLVCNFRNTLPKIYCVFRIHCVKCVKKHLSLPSYSRRHYRQHQQQTVRDVFEGGLLPLEVSVHWEHRNNEEVRFYSRAH